MIRDLWQWVLPRFERLAVDEADTGVTRVRKTLLVFSSITMGTLAIAWGSIYLAFGEPLAAVIPYFYALLSYTSVVYFVRTRRYDLFRFIQLGLILLLPWLLMLALGGFRSSSAVILWSLVSPVIALIFDERQRAPRWFAALVALVIASGLLEAIIRDANRLPSLAVTLDGPDAMPVISLAGSDVSAADLSEGRPRGADAREAQLMEADLSLSNLHGAKLAQADLRDAYLSEADLSGADLVGANLDEATLTNLVSISGADFTGAANLSAATRLPAIHRRRRARRHTAGDSRQPGRLKRLALNSGFK